MTGLQQRINQALPLRAQRQADGVENIDEVARRARLAQRGDSAEHVHLFGADVVRAPDALVVAKFLPGRAAAAAVGGAAQQIARTRIGEQEQLAALQAQHLAKPRDHFLRGMALAGLQVPDIRSRSLDPPCDVFLSEIEPAAALADDGAESSLNRFWHRMSF